MKVMEKQMASGDIDEEDVLKLKSDLTKVSCVASQIMELTGQLCEIFKEAAYPCVRDNAVPHFAKNLEVHQELDEDELLDALCFFCDYVENTPARDDKVSLNQLAAKFLEIDTYNADEQPDFIHQTICYGFGVFGFNLGNGEFKVLEQAVARCKDFLKGEDAFEADRIVSSESTLGALAKMSYKHLDNSVISNADLSMVLSKMPFTSFEDENKSSHRNLMQQFMIMKKDSF